MFVVITPTGAGAEAELVALFTASFTASEGAQEGALIGQRVQDLLTQTPAADLYVCREYEGEELVGACCFSRLSYQAAGAAGRRPPMAGRSRLLRQNRLCLGQ